MIIEVEITKQLEQLEVEKTDLKTKQEMIEDVLINDPILTELKEKLDDAKRRYTLEREAILNEPENRALIATVKEIKQTIKDIKDLLSSDLLGYFKNTGSLTLETDNKVLHISFVGTTKKDTQVEPTKRKESYGL